MIVLFKPDEDNEDTLVEVGLLTDAPGDQPDQVLGAFRNEEDGLTYSPCTLT